MIRFITCLGFLLAGWALASCPPEAPAPIEDPRLLLRITGPLGADRVYTCADLARLTHLGGSGDPAFGIRSLEGLQHAVNLEALALPRNHIQDLSLLKGLPRLRSLYLAENEVSDLSPMAELPGLTELDLRGNRVRDLTPLAGLARLERLELRDNAVASLEPLRGLTALRWLSLYENRVTDVAPLASLRSLRVLDLRNNDVVDFDALAGLTGLEELHLGEERYVGEENFTPVMRQPPPGDTYRFAVPMLSAELAWLAELTGLTHLSVSSLHVGDAGFLEALTGLENLSLRNAGVTPQALARVARLRELRYLDVSNNWLTELKALLAGPVRLEGLWAAWNCLELSVDAGGRVLDAFVGAVEPHGLLLVAPQRPAEQCQEDSN